MKTDKLMFYNKRLKMKLKYTCNHLWFNSQCQKLKIFRRYINKSFKPSVKPKTHKNSILTAKLSWLNSK